VEKAGTGPVTARLAAMPQSATTPTTGRFIIVAELRTKPVGPFEAAMAGFGQAHRLADRIWLLRGEATIGTVHNELMQHLGKSDSLFIAEMGSSRTTVFNWGPEIEARIRAWRA
jgi:hypothetical protein